MALVHVRERAGIPLPPMRLPPIRLPPIRLALVCLAVVVGLLGMTGGLAAAQGPAARLALVIGNGDYPQAPLRNPVNDAALMTETLRRVGFEVEEFLNADRRGLTKAFHAFADRLNQAGDGTVALIYYAGHGAQLRGENYLIPVDARIEEQLDIEIEGVRASSLLEILNQTGNRLNIVVFDACRNNPFVSGTRSASRGLARMDAPTGTLLAYSTAPGRTAVDGDGRNSPYTRALARTILAEGLKVEEVFKRVRISVMERTDEQQIPWESSSLTGDFYFVAPSAQAASAGLLAAEIKHWKRIAYSQAPGDYRDYLDQYPDGAFTDLARQRIAALIPEGPAVVTEAPAPQTAMLPPVPAPPKDSANRNPYDGIWRFTYATTGQFRPKDFCRKGETAEARLEVRNGRIESRIDSNFLGSAYLIGSVDAEGTVDVVLKGKEWPGSDKITGSVQGGPIEGTKLGVACHGTYTLSYLDDLDPPQTVVTPNGSREERSYDGRYRLIWKLIGAYKNWEFCREGEEADAEVEIRDGKFNADVNSNKGSNAVFSGSVSDGGFLLGEFLARNWGRPRAVAGNLALGPISTKAFGKACHTEYTLSYLGPAGGASEAGAGSSPETTPAVASDR